ncbi:MAG: glucose/galactose MFS transporter, partial [Gluconacetobacter diazotrophicus]|nr:glucose/galactose MFS transporter [Gluconacetobacter diazotrophicus]
LLLAEGFNSLGTVLGPLAAAELLFRGGVFDPAVAMAEGADARGTSLWAIGHQFELVSLAIAAVFVLFWINRRRLWPECGDALESGGVLSAFRSGWGLFGAFAVFCYVGAEVSSSTLMVNFLSQPDVLAVTHQRAAQLLGLLFWGGAMLGRFGGSQLLRVVRPGRLLGVCALVNAALCLFVSQQGGVLAGAGALSLGLFDSVMFPLVFTLTLQRSGARSCSLSGLMCTAIAGGAVLPPLAGIVADRSGIGAAFAVPLAGYVGVAVFAIMGRTRLMRP